MSYKNESTLLNRPFLSLYVTGFVVSFITALATVQYQLLGIFLASESGPIQIFTVVGYCMACVVAVFLQWKGQISSGYQAALIFLALGLRELDFHDRFTTMGIMKSRFYISDAVPLTEKIIGAVVLLGLTYLVVLFLKKNLRSFFSALRTGNRAALLSLNGFSFLIVSKLIDANSSLIVCSIEETIEMTIPFFFLFAMILGSKQGKDGAVARCGGGVG